MLDNEKIKAVFLTSVQLLGCRLLEVFCNYTTMCKSFPATLVLSRNLDMFYLGNTSGWLKWQKYRPKNPHLKLRAVNFCRQQEDEITAR